MKNNLVVASDIGGTHITSAIVDISTWQILEDTISRSHVNSKSDAKSIFLSWTSCIKRAMGRCKTEVTRVGIAMPGPFDYDNGISLMKNQDKYDALYQMNVSVGLIDSLEKQKDIRFINDAAAFLQGEIFAGDLHHYSSVLGVTLRTALRSAVWRHGERAFDADLWNTPYKDGIFEEFLVTRWLTKRFKELSGIAENGFKDILLKHQHTDAFGQLMIEYTKSLYDFFKYFAEKHQATSFILGGNITNAWPIVKAYNEERFSEFEIHTGRYAEQAAILGAASLFKD